ncbi:NAD-dependent epimerase/dehydratase family protein [uncultured Maribacter sp.]|uniref:NAD-dependent epimerase/dehydratase family protein n=1 Tax=uncultured Maribacter sp. TaxID=431308 RepID=UPI002624ECF1|nr:NAD-dependent epimerase/dehydratase family protein [uncultured Maribacter sp.]
MKILVTGAHGFLGSHFCKAWQEQNHEIVSLGKSNNNNIICDLSKNTPAFNKQIDIVLHIAGKAHTIPKTEAEKEDFFNVNVNGTKNLLKGLTALKEKPKSLLYISTVGVYGLNSGELIPENSSLLAKDPYGLSKIHAENLVLNWGKKNNIPVSIIRPPLIIGKNAPGNLFKMIKGIKNNRYANIGGGKAKRSMVLAEDIANFSLTLIDKQGIYNLTDGYDPSFYELSHLIGKKESKKITNIPFFLAKLIALSGDLLSFILRREMPFSSNKLKKMTSSLTYDITLAKKLGWAPRKVLENSKIWL